ncbi:hypothetical protein HYH03_001831 [Edaphochlamys debaryana]|uniref:Uncharacterized protein n=1 Tax=Edaphochlamys debaryana TaxID=47281 RepID=A0A835YCN5_9CHLO|nr:hypothetical protein HYH03_001831 [Edaphochlamys debaryana]|eukprot:KAG2500253.1 hypothetical protein HYH03_001831 [Edaphochlamys debaryana]
MLALVLLASLLALPAVHGLVNGTIDNSPHVALDAEPSSGRNSSIQLESCWNKLYNPTPTTFASFLGGQTLSLRLRRVWWSSRSTRIPVTIFTTATLDRLEMLAAQCRSYPGGPLVGAVYLPLVQRQSGALLTHDNERAIERAEEVVQALFAQLESERSACQPRLLLLYEVASDPALASLVPINAVRNAALLAVRTPLAAMVDVDLRVSKSLVALVSEPRTAQQLVAGAEGAFWVLPAWDVPRDLGDAAAEEAALSALNGDKLNLAKLWAGGKLHWFGQLYFQAGHAPTNHTRWLMSPKSYVLDFAIGFEPWGIVKRDVIARAPYDGRFRGCYNDKITHVVSLHHARLAFRTLPNAWVVHRPHAFNPAASIAKGAVAKTTSVTALAALLEHVQLNGKNLTKFEHHKNYSHVLLDEAVVHMLADKYDPHPGKQYTYCRLQVQGSPLEASCGAPCVIVLTVIVPADRVLECMDRPLLEQPPLLDAQGRNVIGGPDVDVDGSVSVTPLEQTGIAHLDNFALVQPWNEQTAAAQVSGQLRPLLGAIGGGPEHPGGPGVDSARGPSASCSELCMLVQLVKRSSELPGKWDVFRDMPHLVSRPFQVYPRSAFQSAVATIPPSVAVQHTAARRRQQAFAALVLSQSVRQVMTPSSPPGNSMGEAQVAAQQQRLSLTLPPGGPTFCLGPSTAPAASSQSAGSQRGGRSRRRSCLSKDSTTQDDGTALGPGTVLLGPPRHSTGSDAVSGGTPHTTSGGTAFGRAGTEVSTAPAPAGPSGAPSGGRAALQQEPSSTLQELLEELENQPGDELTEVEGRQKRAKSNLTTNDVAAFLSDNSMTSLSRDISHSSAGGPHLSGNSSSSTSGALPVLPGLGVRVAETGVEQQLLLTSMRRQASGLGRVSQGGSGGGPLDSLFHLLGQPAAMQDVLDRMAQEQQEQQHEYEETQARGSNGAETHAAMEH